MAQNEYVGSAIQKRNQKTKNSAVAGDFDQVHTVVKARQLPLSKFENFLLTFFGIVLAGLMIVVVSGKITLSNAQHSMEATQEKVTQTVNQNTVLKQEVSQLSDQGRLDQVAKQGDLSLNSGSIRNVNK
ncbi:cell division protein FtsL [Pediococcus claussenii]|uniref:Cell division protein FtsL n=1 Tax=Pediococcus claussenii (strain ATCC BAA-344 / DSM 14800 / JCM 18046 / KCTC 3811 / LMG 21948 / P06) TaxID=701521 RepID=G8PCU0_PEDCP|nr:cell division protein FtsL [Pediococcus claussenii]AEV95075.1 cell division protein FtsL [Pediococcus claussenii ATCC BAA-344]ANZ70263.1 cell division protein FtsL [Pediococcus claussenii]ANZ72079.1 cell division protein FtsL [Pediococcus claussenii]KRN18936.1 ftsL protein [Pediococcus claussenii]